MIGKARTRVLPASQRRSLDELTEDLDLSSGDTTSKRSAIQMSVAGPISGFVVVFVPLQR